MNKTKISLLSSGLAVIAGLVVVSCKPEEINNVNGPVVDGNGNTYVTTECITPVRYVEGSYTASSTGVSVKMDEVSSNNIRFTCEPGTDINSFLVQVYPLGTFYNTLLEAMKAEGKTSLTVNDTNDYIAQAVRLTGEGATSGGVLYSRADLGDDFNSVEIDLASSSIIPYRILPGVDYIVIVQACFDDEATRYGDLAICHVEATPKDVSGDVTVGVQLTPSINSVGVTLTPGSDCKYVIYHGNYQSEIDEYINAYGDEMYHDLLCHSITQPQSVDGLDLDFRISDLTPESDYCVSAVAFDAAMTPAARITRADCALKTVPEDAEDGEYFEVRKLAFAMEDSFDLFIEQLRARSVYSVPIDVSYGDALLSLVTCSYEQDDGRFILVCRKMRDGETREDVIAAVRETSTHR